MISSIIDTLNNLQNINTPAAGKTYSAGGENTSVSYMDNKHSSSFIKDGFEKVYEQKTGGLKDSQTESKTQTLGDVKESFQKIGGAVSEEVQSFKDLLSKSIDESNAESSLDLTLARDINEIISELKEAAGITNDKEENSEDTDFSAEADSETAEGEDTEMDVKDLEALLPAGAEQINYSQSKIQPEDSEESSDLQSVTSVDENDSVLNESESNTSDSSSTLDIFEMETDVNNTEASKSQSAETDFESVLEEDALRELNVESVEAETDTSPDDGSSLMDNQSPQEQAVKAMLHSDGETFELNTVKTNQLGQSNQQVQAKTADITPSKIIEQITKQMEGLFNNSRVNIVLNPESLGRVNIQLLNSSDGLSAHFTVASNEVRDLLMKGLDGLKDTLASHGVSVDNVSVKVNDTQKEADTSDWTEQEGSRGGNKEQSQPDREEKEQGLFEKTMAQTNDNFENGKV